jgi:5-formyltetrahydrofolate cyclo-ligase
MTGDVTERKRQLRIAAVGARRLMADAARDRAGAAITDHGLERWLGVGTIAAFVSVDTEPPTRTLLDHLVGSGTRVLLPVIDAMALDWAAYTGPADLTAGPLGITEPTTPRLGADAVLAADIVLVPALAVDRSGNRLGRGRGFYDRALIDVAAPIVAVVYDDELLDVVPAEAHDHRVDAVLRPAGITAFS